MRALVKPRARSAGQLLLELALAAADDRRQHVDALVLRIEHHHVDDALERLARRSRVPQFGQCGTPMLANSSRR